MNGIGIPGNGGFIPKGLPGYKKNSGYTYDLYNILYPFREKLRFNFIPGDVTIIPDYPTFVKSRPIEGKNDNSVLFAKIINKNRGFVKTLKNDAHSCLQSVRK